MNLFDITGKKPLSQEEPEGLAMVWQRAFWKPAVRWLL